MSPLYFRLQQRENESQLRIDITSCGPESLAIHAGKPLKSSTSPSHATPCRNASPKLADIFSAAARACLAQRMRAANSYVAHALPSLVQILYP